MTDLSVEDGGDLATIFGRYRREIDVAMAVHLRVAGMLKPGGEFVRAAMRSALHVVGEERAWGEAVLRSAMALRADGIDVLGLLRSAGETGDRAGVQGPQGSAGAPRSPAKVGPTARANAGGGGAAAAGAEGLLEGPRGAGDQADAVLAAAMTAGGADTGLEAGGPAGQPAGVAAAALRTDEGPKPRGPARLAERAGVPAWPDPGEQGAFVCLVRGVDLEMGLRNPNYVDGSAHPARQRKLLVTKLYEEIYGWQHAAIVANGLQLPAGWVLPEGAVLASDGHVVAINP